ncbi:MAG: 23S rRNA (uridine(2479)-2'-O)-methyltransferase [Candidatus Anoxychlamydiales bacterium]|nr:23S rRNA (uridine(2479)-2'-O)-methyltransferase [Candidatus Anoxychlamydiales bacterium]
MIEITSLKNDKIKLIEKLKNKNKRDKYKLFLIEGYREISRAIEANVAFDSLYISNELFLGSNEDALIDKFENKNIQIFKLKKEIFEKISYRDRPDGLLAIAKQKQEGIEELENILKNKKNPFLLAIESIEKPGNLGSILRSSDAAKIDCVIVCDPKTDIFNPNVVRSSIGTLFTQKVIIANSTDVIDLLEKNNINIIATTPNCNKYYTQIDLTLPICIVMGSEQYGLSDKWLNEKSIKVKLPMRGKADSLNVAAATTIMLYETLRQRKLF